MTEEVQILKGPALTVTDRRITALIGEMPVTPVLAPRLEEREIIVPVRTTFVALGLMFGVFGLFGLPVVFWLTSAVLFGASVWVKVKRRGFEVSIETGRAKGSLHDGERKRRPAGACCAQRGAAARRRLTFRPARFLEARNS